MTLIDNATAICKRLAPGGWHNLLLKHGLDILAPCLATELRKPLTHIDRTLAGFEDFCPTGQHGIEPGKPAQSLLYHALASPNVTHDAQGTPLQDYPTTAELETLLNLVYGIDPPSIEHLKERAQGAPLAVVVFSHEYRPAPDTVHKARADLCFSRTGIARVGTMPALYDPQRRGFLPFVEGQDHQIRVLPARYSAFVAIQRKGDQASFGPMRFGTSDGDRDFWVPVHKLFDGDECIAGMNLELELLSEHKNEKLRRIHLALGANSGWGEPDISRQPFVINEGLADWLSVIGGLVTDEHDPGLLCPLPRDCLVEAARYQGKPLTFRVPGQPLLLDSSLSMPPHAPEFVHIRHQVLSTGDIIDLNQSPSMMEVLNKGRFDALHYLDFTADGWINAKCAALDAIFPQRVAAYSLISAPDFYPLCTQRQLSEWLESMPTDIQEELFSQPPVCLSDVRSPANLSSFAATFDRSDTGITAIVAQADTPLGTPLPALLKVDSARRASYLPDAAAGLFAPGWDVGTDFEGDVFDYDNTEWHLAAYRLGSPFPEDAKLCAALSSFWPAVAPDTVQQFEPSSSRQTVKPMLDAEIGKAGGVPWDGTPAPHHYSENGQPYIAFTSSLYGDYTQSALDGAFSLTLTGKVDAKEYQQRMSALLRVRSIIGKTYKEWRIISFRLAIEEDMKELDHCLAEQVKSVQTAYRFEMARLGSATSTAFNKVHVKVIESSTFLVWPETILQRYAERPWRRT